jgi:peptide/nickel transport system substrate-binding protein
MARFNHLHKPFDNAKVRQAALAAMTQEPFLRAQVGVKELYKSCYSMFICNTPYGTTGQRHPGQEQHEEGAGAAEGQRLRRHAGRHHEADRPGQIQKLPDVAAQLLRQAGFKVDLQAMDWQTLVGRRAKKDAPSRAAGTCS